jgi:hypothetical protein
MKILPCPMSDIISTVSGIKAKKNGKITSGFKHDW